MNQLASLYAMLNGLTLIFMIARIIRLCHFQVGEMPAEHIANPAPLVNAGSLLPSVIWRRSAGRSCAGRA